MLIMTTPQRPSRLFRRKNPPSNDGDGSGRPAIFKKEMPAEKIVFCSDDLPAELDDRARFSLWRDLYTTHFGSFDLSYTGNVRFSMRTEWTRFGAVKLRHCGGTINRVARTSRNIAVDGDDSFCVTVNSGSSPVAVCQHGREAVLDGGMGVLLVGSEPGEVQSGPDRTWISTLIPRTAFLELVPNAQDLLATPLNPGSSAFRHLRRYLGILLGPDGIGNDPALIDQVETTILDLAALSLGAGRDAGEVASMRGLRAARTQEILAQIRTNFANPAFSIRVAAKKLGLSPRYVQDLLQATSLGFTERVLELRLQKVRAMLEDPRHDRLKINEIAYACGFSEVPYFNRCFRRRFGASPKDVRAVKVER